MFIFAALPYLINPALSIFDCLVKSPDAALRYILPQPSPGGRLFAAYTEVRLIPQDLRALPAELFTKPSEFAIFLTFYEFIIFTGHETEGKSTAALLIISFNLLNISLKEKRRRGWFAQGELRRPYTICSIISLCYKISPPCLHFWHGFFIRNKAKETKTLEGGNRS